MTPRQFVRGITPPFLVAGYRHVRQRLRHDPRLPEWEFVPEGWQREQRDPAVTGWNVPGVLDAYRTKLATFRDVVVGSGPLAVPTSASVTRNVTSVSDQNAILAFAYSLLLASRGRDTVSILDWGGGVGLYALLARALLPSDVGVEFHCKELPLVCAYGREAMPEVQFHDDESCLARTYDLVFASSSIQYREDWGCLLGGLARATGGYLYLARVPVVVASPSFVVLQRASAHGFGTAYLSWVFNRDELITNARHANLHLEREFLLGYKPKVHGAPEQDETRGMLFTHG
jgi:putative methyltransferase (TIGR04325 family)